MLPGFRPLLLTGWLMFALGSPGFSGSPGVDDKPLPPKSLSEPDRKENEGATPQVFVRHHDRSGEEDWSVAETANFRIFHNQSPALAQKVAQVAEQTRTAMFRKWLARAGADWNSPCMMYVYATGADYQQATGAASSPGHSTIERRDGGVVGRRIDVHCDEPTMLAAVLPHETTHVVLADEFGVRPLPRWADEGMAVLTEPRPGSAITSSSCLRCSRDGQLFAVRELVELEDYPASHSTLAFYAQSTSVVEFLAAQKGPPTFIRFLHQGMGTGYESALKHYYGWDFDELERRWQRHAFGKENRPAEVGG